MGETAIVFGRAGQLGAELVSVFGSRGYEVHAFARADVDVTDIARVAELVSGLKPAVVLNATAYNTVDLAEREPEAAFAANALAVRNMAVACRDTGAKLVHVSTDYVFDGTLGRPYTEEDATHPISAYGVSKLAGELYALAYLEDALVIRTSGVFGVAGVTATRGNFVETMLRLAAKNQTIRVVEDSVASPTYASELAERTADLVELGASGIVHGGGDIAISWLDYARMVFEESGIAADLQPTYASEHRTPARRPKFSALANARMKQLGVPDMRPLRECVREYLKARRPLVTAA